MKRSLLMLLVVALPAASWAQVNSPSEQQRFSDWRSATQKAGLVTIGIAVGLGIPLLANKESLGTDGLCKAGDPMLGHVAGLDLSSFACGGGLAIAHFVFAAATLGLFITSEIFATLMNPSPYDTFDPAAGTIRWVNVGLFTLQPLLGLLAAHPGLIGIPPEHRVVFSRVLRSIHMSVGLALVSTYTLQAGLMW